MAERRVKKRVGLADQYGRSREDLDNSSSSELESARYRPEPIFDTALPDYEALPSILPAASARPSVTPPERLPEESATIAQRIKPKAIFDTAISEPEDETLIKKVEEGKKQIQNKDVDAPASTVEGAAADAAQDIKDIGSGGKISGKRIKSGIAEEAPLTSEVAYKDYVSTLERLSKKEMETDDPSAKNIYKAAQDEAKRLYEQRETRAAWASLAETIGTGLLKLGMAQTAKQGVDVSKIPWEKPTDWEPTLARAERRYFADLESARKDYVQTKEEADRARGLEAKNLQREAELKKDIYQQKLKEDEAEKERQLRERLAQMQREADLARLISSEERQTQKTEQMLDQREISAQKSAITNELSTLSKDKTIANKQLQSAQTLANNILASGDLSSKSKEKLQRDFGELAGVAGVPLAPLVDDLKKYDTPEGQQLVLQKMVNNFKIRLAEIEQTEKEKRQDLSKVAQQERSLLTGKRPKEEPPVQVEAQPAAEETVRIQGPSGQIADVPRSKANKYLGQPGYSLVK